MDRIQRTPSALVRAASLAALCVLAVACGGAQQVVPTNVRDASSVLQGTWTVRDATGAVDGDVMLGATRLETRWDDVTLVGTWEHVTHEDNRYTVTLRISEAREGELLHRFGTLDDVTLDLVFVSQDRLVALQHNGAWTEWTRVVEDDAGR